MTLDTLKTLLIAPPKHFPNLLRVTAKYLFKTNYPDGCVAYQNKTLVLTKEFRQNGNIIDGSFNVKRLENFDKSIREDILFFDEFDINYELQLVY